MIFRILAPGDSCHNDGARIVTIGAAEIFFAAAASGGW
jgi:hypothetical protein